MKKFNKDIQVTVSVDSVANNLLAKFNTEFAHATTMVETIIGIALNTNNVDQIYNVLNGFTNDIDFKVGQEVKPLNFSYSSASGGDYQITSAIIVGIDTTRANEKVQIEYEKYNGRKETTWVNHATLENIVLQEEQAINM